MNIHRYLFAASLIGLLSACATVKATYSDDGRKAYTLNCGGTVRGWDKCFAAAGELCKTSGYDILDRRSKEEGERSMVVACKR